MLLGAGLACAGILSEASAVKMAFESPAGKPVEGAAGGGTATGCGGCGARPRAIRSACGGRPAGVFERITRAKS